jgi:hypothetical protein
MNAQSVDKPQYEIESLAGSFIDQNNYGHNNFL